MSLPRDAWDLCKPEPIICQAVAENLIGSVTSLTMADRVIIGHQSRTAGSVYPTTSPGNPELPDKLPQRPGSMHGFSDGLAA